MLKLSEVEAQTQDVYEKNAERYDKERSKELFEKKYLDLFLKRLPTNKKVLDLGCGAGDPIATYLVNNKCHVTGADYSKSMLSLFQSRFSKQKSLFVDMRELSLNENYDGIISWGAFFHLNKEQQRKNLPTICDHLNPLGILMITVGPEEGEVTGTVAGELVYHSSLSKSEYEDILKANDMEVLIFNLQDPECNGFSAFIARKLSV